MDEAALDRVMAEAGPRDDGILACLRMADGAHVLRFEDVDVIAEWDGARARLVLSSEIGKPPRAREAEVYGTLLSYNLLWRETGGVRIALTEPGGRLLQLVDLSGDEVEPAKIATMAANLAERALVWQAYIAAAPEADTDLPPIALTDVVIRA